MTKLSPHFTLDEMTFSQTAARKGIDNTPPPRVLSNLTETARRMEAVRTLLGSAIFITSGYRCYELNVLIGGSPSSAHMLGWAVDFTCPGYGSARFIWEALKVSNIKWDQCVLEFSRWVHLSFDPRMRGEVLKIG